MGRTGIIVDNYFVALNGQRYTRYQIREKLNHVLERATNSTKTELEGYIDAVVPQRTGQLRDDIKKWVNVNFKKDPYNFDYRLSIGSTLEYARKIKGDVVHVGSFFEHSGAPAKAFYYGYFGDVFLYDPKAEKDFWEILKEFIQITFQKYYVAYRNDEFGGLIG